MSIGPPTRLIAPALQHREPPQQMPVQRRGDRGSTPRAPRGARRTPAARRPSRTRSARRRRPGVVQERAGVADASPAPAELLDDVGHRLGHDEVAGATRTRRASRRMRASAPPAASTACPARMRAPAVSTLTPAAPSPRTRQDPRMLVERSRRGSISRAARPSARRARVAPSRRRARTPRAGRRASRSARAPAPA